MNGPQHLPAGPQPITEEWLRAAGFKWHEVARDPHKHWLLWLGWALGPCQFVDPEDLGVELASSADETWFCWLRADTSHRYHRFIHVRHLTDVGQLVRLIEGLTGQAWDPANNWCGAMRTPEAAAHLRAEADRLDRRIAATQHPWEEDEQRPDHAGPLLGDGGPHA